MTRPEPPGDLPELLRSLGFRASPEALGALLTHAHNSRLGPTETLEQLAALERRAQQATNLARRTKLAQLGAVEPLDRFDWSHPRKIDRTLFERLLGLDFIPKAENVLFRGPSGAGKTTLAKALGHAALIQGYSVRFATLASALAELLRLESLPAFERRLKR